MKNEQIVMDEYNFSPFVNYNTVMAVYCAYSNNRLLIRASEEDLQSTSFMFTVKELALWLNMNTTRESEEELTELCFVDKAGKVLQIASIYKIDKQ